MAAYASGKRALFSIRQDGSELTVEAVVGDRSQFLGGIEFSADGRYLAYNALVPDESGFDWVTLTVIDLKTRVAEQHYPSFPGSAAWAPTGHGLALATQAGVAVIDVATGERRWVDLGVCSSVAWFPPSVP